MNKTIYVRDAKLWDRVSFYADTVDLSVSRVIELALREFLKIHEHDTVQIRAMLVNHLMQLGYSPERATAIMESLIGHGEYLDDDGHRI